jgi:outer membrane protein assembly factor BamB
MLDIETASLLCVCGLQAKDAPGRELWHVTTGAGILSSPAIGPDGTVYCGADDGYLYAFPPLASAMDLSSRAKF